MKPFLALVAALCLVPAAHAQQATGQPESKPEAPTAAQPASESSSERQGTVVDGAPARRSPA
jgi:hypothetical protein